MNRRLAVISLLAACAAPLIRRAEARPAPSVACAPPAPPVTPQAVYHFPMMLSERYPALSLLPWADFEEWPRGFPPARLHSDLLFTRYNDKPNLICATYRPVTKRQAGEDEYLSVSFDVDLSSVAWALNAFGLEYVGSCISRRFHVFRRSQATDDLLRDGNSAVMGENCKAFAPFGWDGVITVTGYCKEPPV